MPRNITPSDIDAVIDYNGHVLMMEFSSSLADWYALSAGQRRLYESLVRAGQGKITAVLCHHSTPPDELINTVRDVVSFQPMWYETGDVQIGKAFPGERWVPFVQKWQAGGLKKR